MIVLLVCLWKLAQGLMCFDHQGSVSNVGPLGSQHSHHTTLRGNKVWLCVKKVFHMSMCICVCICFRTINMCVFLRHLWTHRSGSSSVWQQRPYSIVRL